MLTSKLAIIATSLPFVGKPMPQAPTPRPKTKTMTPGLGEKMRSETSKALETMLKRGSFQTGLEGLVKMASGIPTAQASGASLGTRLWGATRALPGQAWSVARKPLALAGLGAAGALAYGMHRQNVEDRERNALLYAPMQGTVMG